MPARADQIGRSFGRGVPSLLSFAADIPDGARRTFSLGNPKFSPPSLIGGGAEEGEGRKLGTTEGLSMALFIKVAKLIYLVCQDETDLSPATNYVARWLSLVSWKQETKEISGEIDLHPNNTARPTLPSMDKLKFNSRVRNRCRNLSSCECV